MKAIYIFLLSFLSLSLLAEDVTTDETKVVIALRSEVSNLKRQEMILSQRLEAQKITIDRLVGVIDSLKRDGNATAEKVSRNSDLLLKSELKQKELLRDLNSNEQILNKRSILVFSIILALALLLVLFWLLMRKGLHGSVNKIYAEISQTKKNIEEESIKLDSELLKLADKQLDILKRQPLFSESENEFDHSMTLKIADEVIRIQMNLLNIDPNIKGHKQLTRAAESIMDNLNANGYEIPQLLNKQYDDRMKAIVTMILDENLPAGERIIRRILKPQVNFQGSMIQAAELVVAFND